MNLWDATLESKPAERESLKKTEEVDVAIIGAGFTGLWSAYHLLSHNPDLKISPTVKRLHLSFYQIHHRLFLQRWHFRVFQCEVHSGGMNSQKI